MLHIIAPGDSKLTLKLIELALEQEIPHINLHHLEHTSITQKKLLKVISKVNACEVPMKRLRI